MKGEGDDNLTRSDLICSLNTKIKPTIRYNNLLVAILLKAGGSRLEKLEEMQWSTVRQKDASETEGEGIQNSDAIWGRNVGYNEETRKTD